MRVGALPVLSVVMLFAAGCSLLPAPAADPTKYYVLTDRVNSETTRTPSPEALHLVLRGIELPGYLRSTRAMVVRDGLNEIRYLDYARWAELLDQGIARVVKTELLHAEAVASVEPVGLPSDFRRAYDISVRVHLCEGGVISGSHNVAKFSASYEITSLETKRVVVQKTFSAPEAAWNGDDFSGHGLILYAKHGAGQVLRTIELGKNLIDK